MSTAFRDGRFVTAVGCQLAVLYLLRCVIDIDEVREGNTK